MKANRIKIKTIWLICLAPFVFASCLEDPIQIDSFGSVSGIVTDSFNDRPLSGVEIDTNPSSSVVISDSLGAFLIPEIAVGEYSFTAQFPGYEKTFVNVTVAEGIKAEVEIKMDRQFSIPDHVTNPTPSTGAKAQPREVTLIWEGSPSIDDTLSYDVFVYESNIDSIVFSSFNLSDTFLTVDELRYETTYFWQVNAKSGTGGESKGDIWNFTTLDFPDNRFLYTSKSTGNYQICSSNDSATQAIQITRTLFNSLSPRYSTDRKEIAYTANGTLENQVYLMNYKGENNEQITNIPVAGFHSNGSEFCWWPDNGGFLYSHYDILYSIDRRGANLTPISTAPSGRHFGDLDYSGSTDKIVVQTIGSLIYEGEIYIMNSNGSDTLRIVDDLPGIIEHPTFSIDGKKVMYTRDFSGFDSPDGRQLDSRIYILDLATMIIDEVSGHKPEGTNDMHPRFSPFGSKIIFTNALNDGSGVSSVYEMNLDGTGRNLLFEDAEMPDWK